MRNLQFADDIWRKIKLRNKYVKWFIKHKVAVLGVVACLLVGGLGFSIYKYKTDMNTLKTTDQQQIQTLQEQASSKSRTGYVATTDIKQGDILQDGVNVTAGSFASDADQTTFADSSCINKQAVVSIPSGSPITNNVVATAMDKQLNERECTFFNLSANLKEGDFVDIRILFPNGEDPIVVSKVSIQKPVVVSNLCYLWLTADQISNLDAAAVDANLHGAIIYTTKYIEPEVQPANVVNYQPNAAVIDLMKSDPNIIQESISSLSVSARQGLEDRLKAFEKAYPDFKLNLKNSDDVDEALKNIGNANNAGSSSGSTDSSGTTSQPSTQSSTDTSSSASGSTDTAESSSSSSSSSSDTTVTYGN
jgi:hypothetical protein